MTISDVLLIFATIIGPIAAVQAQKFVERAGERRRRKVHIFYTLMANRATHLAPERIQALNMIDLEFRPNKVGYQSSKANAVTSAWKLLLDEFTHADASSTDTATIAAWNRRCDDLSIDLLFALSNFLGFKFSKVELRRGIYYPRGHGETEAAQRAILSNLAKILSGQQSLPMAVTAFPASKEMADLQTKYLQELTKVASGEAALKVLIQEQKRGL
jgi:hypothetical protein